MLASLHVELGPVREQVVRFVGQGDEPPKGQIPFTPRAKKVLELALRECMSLGHDSIGTEHLLLALVREEEGLAAQVLREFDALPNQLRAEVLRSLGGPSYPRDLPPPPPPHFSFARPLDRPRSPHALVLVTWALGAVTLGAGILIGWAIWG